MSNGIDYTTRRPSQDGPSRCPPDCPRPSSSKNPVCDHHRPFPPRPGHRPLPPGTLGILDSQRSSSPSLDAMGPSSPDPKTKSKSKTPAVEVISYNERLRKFLLFCIAVELDVESSLEREEILTKEEFILFVELAQFYCAKCQSSNTKNVPRERELRAIFTDAAKEMGLDVHFAYSMLPTFIKLMQPLSKGKKIYHRITPPFWKSTLGQPKDDEEVWTLMTTLEIYRRFIPQLTCHRNENPLLNQEFMAKIRNGEGEKLSEKVGISIKERMKDAAKKVGLDLEECIEIVRHKLTDGKSDSVIGVVDGKMPGARAMPLPDPGTVRPDFTIALEMVDFMKSNDTTKVGLSSDEGPSGRLIEFCSHAKMRAVWNLVLRQTEIRSDRRRRKVTAVTDNIKARGKRTISRLSWWKPPTPRRLWEAHVDRKENRKTRA
ncbi:hypothetical protein AC579_9829 [Pseudocercospora musae]|uniref:Uncharacterized protein n=1 Tax=Pseudocercospora musae TaxID=113226 RepID=A0A139IVA5_9PEZI|nr:hypothetical protein AC579_9829 [Pseudocercospora musae]